MNVMDTIRDRILRLERLMSCFFNKFHAIPITSTILGRTINTSGIISDIFTVSDLNENKLSIKSQANCYNENTGSSFNITGSEGSHVWICTDSNTLQQSGGTKQITKSVIASWIGSPDLPVGKSIILCGDDTSGYIGVNPYAGV